MNNGVATVSFVEMCFINNLIYFDSNVVVNEKATKNKVIFRFIIIHVANVTWCGSKDIIFKATDFHAAVFSITDR